MAIVLVEQRVGGELSEAALGDALRANATSRPSSPPTIDR